MRCFLYFQFGREYRGTRVLLYAGGVTEPEMSEQDAWLPFISDAACVDHIVPGDHRRSLLFDRPSSCLSVNRFCPKPETSVVAVRVQNHESSTHTKGDGNV
jgi:hypothetical protein